MSNEEEDIPCSRCGKKSEQSLVLSCDHNLCINCAADNLVRNEVQGTNLMPFVVCDICQTKTNIDVETSNEILALGSNNININYQNINLEKNLNTNENLLNFDTYSATSNIISANNKNLNSPLNVEYRNININNKNKSIFEDSDILSIKPNSSETCKEHGEPISYLCLDCMSKCICSECIVHGIHRNHEVLNIKKAYPLILGKTQDLHRLIGDKINDLDNERRIIEQKKSDIGTINQRCKNEIKNAFQVIRIRLSEKEKEIMEKMESTIKDNLNELNTYFHVIQGKIATLNKIIDSLNAHMMRKDELTLINYYCDNKNNILSQIENSDNNRCFNINAISDLKINVDKKDVGKKIKSCQHAFLSPFLRF